MTLELVLRYVAIFILPCIYLTMLATYIFARSSHLKFARLVTIFSLLGALAYLCEFIRLLLPIEWSHFIHVFIVIVLVNAAFSVIVYSIYTLIQPIAKLEWKWLVPVFIIYPVFIIFIGLLEVMLPQWVPVYYMENGWIVREKVGLIILNSAYVVILYITGLILLYLGYKHSKTAAYKAYFKRTILFTLTALVGMLLCVPYVVPPLYGLILIIFTGTLFTYLTQRIDILPAIVKRYSLLFESIPVPTVHMNSEYKILELNGLAERDFSMQKGEYFTSYFDLKVNAEAFEALLARLEEEKNVKGFEISFLNDQQEQCCILIDGSKISVDDEIYYYFMIADVTLEFQQAKQQEYLAHYDSLTGIHNRTYFEKHVTEILAQSSRQCVLGLIDLNFFKTINDTYGHRIGDEVLIFTAKLLQKALPESSLLARLGGDKFVMFFEHVADFEQCRQQLRAIERCFKETVFKVGDICIEVEPKYSLAYCEKDQIDYYSLYEEANRKMNEHKQRIKND